MNNNVHADVEHAMSQDADQAEIDLTMLLAGYQQSAADNARFQSRVNEALQVILTGDPADWVLLSLYAIPEAHPDTPKARQLLLTIWRQKHFRDQRRAEAIIQMTGERKAATAMVAWVAGLGPDNVSFDSNDELWLTSPALEKAGTPWCFWACCCALVGIAQAQAVAEENGIDVADLDPDLYEVEDFAFNTLKSCLSADVDMANLFAYAKRLSDWVRAEEAFQELTDVLVETGYLHGENFEYVLTENGLGAGSLRFYDPLLSHLEIDLDTATELPANNLSMEIRVSKA